MPTLETLQKGIPSFGHSIKDTPVRGLFRFTKKERITDPQDFRRVMKVGKKYFSKNFTLFILPNKSPYHRLGIVTKKEVGLATYRNRLRRYLREFFRLNKYQLKRSLDMVILVKRGCTIRRYQEVEVELKRIFSLWERERS